MDNYKLDLAIGPHRFQAEGPEEAVKAAYNDWLATIRAIGIGSPAAPAQSPPPADPHVDPPPAPADGISQAILDRVYSLDGPAGVSLRVLPSGERREADALLLILYGFNKLRNQIAVTGVRLNQSAEKSGVSLTRIDRTMATRSEYITEAGARKGKRYGLNNPGIAFAEDMLRKILG